MKMARNIALMAAGAGAAMAYQKYNKQVMTDVSKKVNKTMKKANSKLEDMM